MLALLGLLALTSSDATAYHLADLVELAHKQSNTTEENRLMIEKSRTQTQYAHNNLGPSASLNSHYNHQRNIDNNTNLDPFTINMTLSQSIYNPSLNQHITLAELKEQQEQLTAQHKQASSDLAIIQNYLSLCLYHQLITLQNHEKTRLNTLQKQASLSSQVGMTPQHESKLAEARLLEIKNNILESHHQISKIRAETEFQTNEAIDTIYELTEQLPTLSHDPIQTTQEIIEYALANNIEQKVHSVLIEQAKENFLIEQSQYAPTLAATGQIDKQIGHNNQSRSATTATFQIEGSLPLYTHGRKEMALEEKGNAIKQLELAAINSQAQLTKDIKITHNRLQTINSQMNTNQHIIAARQATYESYLASYDHGFTSLPDLLQEQQALFQIQYKSIEDVYDYLYQSALLSMLMGKLDRETVQQIDSHLTQAVNLDDLMI
ncbi:MAG: hypothetical protein CMF46_04565 [Legionellales bacterium]|nr:hypothetical protein [Legionellales bacterium]